MRFLGSMDDAALIDAYLQGDSAAFHALMTRHRGPLMGFLTARVGTEAEDLYQETWSRVANNAPGYTEKGTFRAWLFQIARNQVIDHHRRRGTRIQTVGAGSLDLVSTSAEHPSRPDQIVHAQRIATVVDAAIAAMSEDTAQVVRWRLEDGTPFAEIAQRQGVPLNTALGRMHRGLGQIRAQLLETGLLEEVS
jgi:RNA polymerase sigma-70 factor (ECF subfamily)